LRCIFDRTIRLRGMKSRCTYTLGQARFSRTINVNVDSSVWRIVSSGVIAAVTFDVPLREQPEFTPSSASS
jgi:hypothetical protein